VNCWTRQRDGRSVWKFADRTYERERPQVLSLDTHDSDGNRLADTLAGSAGNSPPDRVATLAGLLANRDRQTAEDQALIRRLAR
jgi:hypothetical protein